MRKLKPKGRNDSHKLDYSIITDNIILGSDFCRKNRCRKHYKEFKKLGVNVEINLTAEGKELPPDNLTSYTWLPVVDGYAPSKEQLAEGAAIINEVVADGKKSICALQKWSWEKSALVAAYLIRFKGMQVDEAIEFIEDKRPEVHIENRQLQALLKYFLKYDKSNPGDISK